MEYSIIFNDKTYELPKKTMAVVKEMDGVLKVDLNTSLSVDQKFKKLHDFVKNVVGKENAREMFGSDKLTEIDLSELTIATRMVVDAYDRPVADYEAEKNHETLDGLPIDKIVSLANAAGKINNIQQVTR